MRRAVSIIILTLFLMMIFTSCAVERPDSDGIKIVCTQFSAYDWVNNLMLGNDAEVILLTDNGVDIHSYQPTARDVVDIMTADLFIYVGGASESWVEDILATSAGDVQTICMTDVVDTICIEHDEHEHSEHEHIHEFDEHVWLSVENARIICKEIFEKLCAVNQDARDEYKLNYEAYDAKLEELHDDFMLTAENREDDVLLFAGRFPFIYLINELDVEYYAAFDGCSSETAASFETVMELAKVADEFNVEYGIVVKGDDYDLAQTIAENTEDKELKFLEMDSLQSVTKEELAAKKSYISAMRENLMAIKYALA